MINPVSNKVKNYFNEQDSPKYYKNSKLLYESFEVFYKGDMVPQELFETYSNYLLRVLERD